MSVRRSSFGARGSAFALALLLGCGGESVRSVSEHPDPLPGADSGLGGAASTSTNPGAAAHTGSAAGSAVSAGGRMTSSAGGVVGGQSAGGAGGSVNAGGPGTNGAGGGDIGATGGTGVGATGGSPSAMGGTSAAASGAGTSSAGSSDAGAMEPPPSEPPPPPTWDTIKLVLTGTSPPCTGAACHGGSGGKIHLGFPVRNDAQLYEVLTEYVSKPCGNLPIVTPGHPEESALVMVLKGPCSEDVPRMPNGCDDEQGNCVPDEYIAAVEQWITEGAQHP